MKRHLPRSVWLLAIFALVLPVLGVAADVDKDDHPFKHIVERNIFALKPPPDPAAEPAPPPPPPPTLAKVILTGILNVLGPPRALLEVTENEPGKQPVAKKPILREGEREGSIEVLSIDLAKNMVRIKNGPIETNLTFPVVQAGPAGPGAGLVPPPPLPILHTPQAAAMPAPGTPEDPNNRRGVIVVGGNQTPPPTVPNQQPGTALQLPTRQIRAGQQAATTDPVAQWVQLKAQEERARQQRNPFPQNQAAPAADGSLQQNPAYPVPPPLPVPPQ